MTSLPRTRARQGQGPEPDALYDRSFGLVVFSRAHQLTGSGLISCFDGILRQRPLDRQSGLMLARHLFSTAIYEIASEVEPLVQSTSSLGPWSLLLFQSALSKCSNLASYHRSATHPHYKPGKERFSCSRSSFFSLLASLRH